jgi:hypothetical protein
MKGRKMDNEEFVPSFGNKKYVDILDQLKDTLVEEGNMTDDQAALAAVGQSLAALAFALVEAAQDQGNIEEVTISTQVVSGILDTCLWIKDRVTLSQL